MRLLKIRYLQLRRDLGIWVFIFAGAAFWIYYSFSSADIKTNLILVGIAAFIVFTYHNRRTDLNFVAKYLGQPAAETGINYNLTILPLSLGFALNGYWPYAFLLHVLVSITGFTRLNARMPVLLFVSKVVPPEEFEWIAGLRTNLILLVLLALIALFLSPVKLFAVVALFLFNTTLLGFYSYYEPRIMLNPHHLNVSDFLKRKAVFFAKIILLSNTPVLFINSCFQTDMMWFNVFFLVGFVLLAAAAIYIKYAGYTPNQSQGFNFDFLVMAVSVLLPFLLPLAVFILFSNMRKAKNTLSFYCDDHS
jgi:hypothetical protein